jgi:hypothetical protein
MSRFARLACARFLKKRAWFAHPRAVIREAVPASGLAKDSGEEDHGAEDNSVRQPRAGAGYRAFDQAAASYDIAGAILIKPLDDEPATTAPPLVTPKPGNSKNADMDDDIPF